MNTTLSLDRAVHDDGQWNLPLTFNFGRDVVDRLAQEAPDRLALLWCNARGDEARYTYEDVARLTNQFANLLASHGVQRGDRVVVMLPRLPQWQIAIVGCIKLGAIPIPCIDMLTAKDVAYRANHAEAAAAVTTAANAPKFAQAKHLRARIALGSADGWTDLEAACAMQPTTFACADMAPDEPAILYYTSGSTGMPKGVTHASRSLFCWRVSADCWLDLRPDDLMWCTADTGWSKAGTSILFGPWSRGCSVLFYDGPFVARQRLELIGRHGVTVFCGAATEYRLMVNEDLPAHDLSRLRLAVSAGEAVNPEVVTRWEEKCAAPLIEAYGQTETLMTVGNSRGMPRRPGSMGRPMPGVHVAVFDEDGRPVPVGEPGQLAVQLPFPQLMLGYWNDPERTARTRARHEGIDYFLTGDMAHIDTDGFVYYDGRADDIISSAGYRIGPTEVENALMEHAAVVECAVVGSADAERGEIVKAFVVLREGFSPSEQLTRELQDHVKQVTAPYKYPRAIAYADELPKTQTGKILRRVLRAAGAA